ncbi:hypothetical protein [Nonomuraea endophytica]|uniref:hypothetical protein n=1 Tax=Nonomuraea endophytica TaxID=714136 RepID=UPI0037CB9794
MGTLRNLRIVLGVDFREDGVKKADRALRKLDDRLMAISKRAAIGAGLPLLAGSAVALTGALLPAAGAVAAMPAAMVATKAAAATLKVGLLGVGEAMEAVATGDAAAFDEALGKLSPNARAFARQVQGLSGELTSLQQSVQDRIFAGLAREIRPLAQSLLPSVRSGMLGVADGFNLGAKEAIAFGRTPMAKGAVNSVFASTGRIMGMLAGATRPAMQVITQLTVKSLPLAERMASWATNGARAGAAFLTSERGAAALERTIDKSGDTLAQLGRIGGNIGRTLIGVFGQMETSGDGVLDTIERLTAKAAAWARSAEGQRQAAEVFRLLRDVASDVAAVLPLVLGPLSALAKLVMGLPEPLRGVVTTGIALVAVLGPLASKAGVAAAVLLRIVSAVRATDGPLSRLRERLSGVGDETTRTRGRLDRFTGMLGGPWGIALTTAAAGLMLFAGRNDEAEARVNDLTDALVANKGALDADAISKIKNTLETQGIYKAAEKLGINLALVTDAALGEKTALAQVTSQLQTHATTINAAGGRVGQYRTAQKGLVGDALLVKDAIGGQNSELSQARDRYQRLVAASPSVSAATKNVAGDVDKVGDAAGRTSTKIDALVTKMNRFKSLAGDADLAAIAFRDSLDGMAEAFGKGNVKIDANTGKIRINTKTGREANRVLIETIQAATDHADKVHKQTNSVYKANVAFGKHITALRGVMEKSGLSKAAIDRLIARYTTAPKAINDALNKIKDKPVKIKVQADGFVTLPGGMRAGLWASGGVLPGYTPGRDPHMFYSPTGGMLGLSGGEAVMRPEWTRAVGPRAVEQMNAAARSGGVSGVKRVLAGGVGPQRLAGEGAFFADGGVISGGSLHNVGKIAPAMARYNRNVGKAAMEIAKAVAKRLEQLGVGGPDIQRALRWARSQAGKPYVWGGVGPYGYDCSGFTSAITNVIQGRSPHSRRHSTHSFGAGGGPDGFVRNRGSGFRVGVTDAGVGHMAGTLGKVNVESRGSRGVVVGPAARGADNGLFTRRYGLTRYDEGGLLRPGYTPVYNGTRKPEYVFTQKQMQGGGLGSTTINLTVQVPPTANKHEVAKEIYDVLRPYMERNKKKLPS